MRLSGVIVAVGVLLSAGTALAHFQEILPSEDVLAQGGTVTLDIVFTHPMQRGPTMEMARPKRVGAKLGGKIVDVTAALTNTKVDGKSAWTLAHELKSPGAAVYFVEPQPYWEAAEQKFIVHYAKVVVDAFASGEGWDEMVGLPVEIRPLVRPTGVWTGNLFRGEVIANGKPVPYAEIEVEYVNDGSITPPNDAFVTQVIKADRNGVFAYAMPRAGWWGFAALVKGQQKMTSPQGKPAEVELGGLMWVKAVDMVGGSKR